MTNVIVPALGEGIEKAIVSYWFVKEGRQVQPKEDLVEITTDKAAFNLPSPCAGMVVQILVKEGTSVQVGAPVCVIDESKY